MRLPDGQVGHFNRQTISLFAGGQSQFSPPKGHVSHVVLASMPADFNDFCVNSQS